MSIKHTSQDELMARRLAALGNPSRLLLLRVLVQAGPAGLSVGQIQEATGMASSTQFHHLSMLVDTGLVQRERAGKEVLNRVLFAEVRAIAEYLMKDCCKGVGMG